MFRSFYTRLSIAILSSFIVIGAVMLLVAEDLAKNYQQEVEQKLHINLAQHLVEENLFKNGEVDHKALKQAFHAMMILGPSFEFYVVSPEGKLETYSAKPGKVKRESIDLAPVHALLEYKKAQPDLTDKDLDAFSLPTDFTDQLDSQLPILGDDPRSPTAQKIFSVAPVMHDGELIAYLYVIIGGEIYDNVVELLEKSRIVKLSVFGFASALFFGLVLILILFFYLTQPLRSLSSDMRTLQKTGFDGEGLDAIDWQDLEGSSKDEVSNLRTAFYEMSCKLQEQYKRIKDVDELRRELISYVSHDLRTPLASIRGFLETWQLRKDQLTDQQIENIVDTSLKNAEQISTLIEQLFQLAYLEGEVELETEAVSIAELAQDIFHRLPKSDIEGIQLEVEPQDSSILVSADIGKLEQVLVNLLENAVRHCDSGDMVCVQLSNLGSGKINVTVADTGAGIPEQEQDKIFQAHYRASNSANSDSKRNSGLGLAITRRIVELHGSKIVVTSTLGKGTKFSFELDPG